MVKVNNIYIRKSNLQGTYLLEYAYFKIGASGNLFETLKAHRLECLSTMYHSNLIALVYE